MAKTTKITTTSNILGKVSNCTLSLCPVSVCANYPVKQINVEERKYCAMTQGYMTQSQGVAHCKTLNARLPLPKSNAESDAFYKEYFSRTWIDITDPGSRSLTI